MTDQKVRLYRIDEPDSRSTLSVLLPGGYRNRTVWPLYVNGVQYQGMTVLLFPAPRGSGVRGGVSMWGHPSVSVVEGTDLLPGQVRTWAIHDTSGVTDVTDEVDLSRVHVNHHLTLPETAYRPTVPSLRVGEHLPGEQAEGPVTDAEQASAFAAQYEKDVAILSSMLIEEAENREWCSEYEEFVSAFNSVSKTVKLSARLVDATWQVEITQTRKVRVLVDHPYHPGEDPPHEGIESNALDLIANGSGETLDQEYEVHSVTRY